MTTRGASEAARGGTLRDRLDAERARLFVGRERELAELEALLAPGSEERVAYVHAPGGIGKTELLRQLSRRARERGIGVGWVDGRAVNPSAFAAAFQGALERASERSAAESGAAGREAESLILVDGLEYLAPIGAWLFQRFLPQQPPATRVVVAGRERPPDLLREPAGRYLARVVPLDHFDRKDSFAYLARRGVPAAQHEPVYRRTFGHPLALSLVAEVVARDAARLPSFDEVPDVVQSLLVQLVRGVPSRRHQLALWSAAMVGHLGEPLLAAVLESADAESADGAATAGDLYRWMQGLTFMRALGQGLAPYELARELLLADLVWRDPTRGHALATAVDQRQAPMPAGLERPFTALRGGTPPPAAPWLTRPQFATAVRQALRSLDRPDLLHGSPLLGSAFRDSGGGSRRVDTVRDLQQLVRDACAMFLATDRDAVYHRVLSATYLESPCKQVEAAELLGMAYGTYRRHLGTAIRRLADALWQRAQGQVAEIRTPS